MANHVSRKLNFPSRTLDDYVVRDGLEAISFFKEPYFLVGGIATQSYLPTSCRRPTSDVDFAVVRPLNYNDFKLSVKGMMEFLRDHGYKMMETKKRSSTFSLDIFTPNGEGLCLEFSRRSKKNFEANKKMLERELDHSNTKILEEKNSSYIVCRAEDIAVPKLARSVGSMIRNPNLEKLIPRLVSYTDEEISKQLKKINDLREEAMISLPNPDLAEQLRFISDLYDIRILSELAGFNYKYLGQVESEWNVLRENPQFREKLAKVVLPKFH